MLIAGTAGAQEKPQRRTIIQFLFGEKTRPEARKPVPPAQGKKQKQRAAKSPSGVAKIAPVEKQPDARTILVVGDFVADALGEGLRTAFETSADIAVETRSNGSSGLVRDDYFDWQTILPSYIAEIRPALVVISLGANDRQPMRIGSVTQKTKTEPWTAEYTNRVRKLATAAQAGQIPVLWVGMPPFRAPALMADMVTLNTIYRAETEKAGGTFVDVWEGFVDEAGKFVSTGSDINGQQVRLRNGDGLNFTKAGKRKIAFYVEKDIRRLLGITAIPIGTTPAEDTAPVPVVAAPIPIEDIVRTLPVSLSDPDLDGAMALMGGPPVIAAEGKSPRDLLVQTGSVTPAPEGRVDDFRLAKPSTVISNPVIRD